jgi:hypothetical protein
LQHNSTYLFYHFLNYPIPMDEIISNSTPNTLTTTTNAPVVKKVYKSNTPTNDINLAALGLRVANKWAAYPQITLLFIAQADFLTKATQFNTFIQQRITEQQTRPMTTRTTRELEADIKLGLKIVRGYLFEKYKDLNKAKIYYPDFGLEKKDKIWVFPTDQQRAIAALGTIKTSIIAHGFGNKDYGTAFWTAMKTDYTTTVQTAISNDGSSSNTVSQKEVLKKELKTAMAALRNAIRANYPDTANGVLRDFGFQKEKV